MASSTITSILYEDCQTDAWTSHTGSSINPVLPDDYRPYVTNSGLVVVNSSSLENGGGLVSRDYAFTPTYTYFGMDITYQVESLDLPHLGRNEMDLKITVIDGSGGALPNQANGSAQQNASENWMWQLDPTGTAWVDTGFNPGPPRTDILNQMGFRYFTDGTKWSVTGMNFNGTTFTPGNQFQNLTMITTNWATGLHPQLQMEVMSAPWHLRQTYTKIRIWQGKQPIPWNF